MHEKGITDNLIKKVLEIAEREDAKKVSKVIVQIGALMSMSQDHLQEHFDISAQGTIAEGAQVLALISSDTSDAHAASILLKSVDIE